MFFTPYFFSHPSVDNPRLSGLFLDSRPGLPNRPIQMEIQYIPSVQAADAKGQVYARVALTSFPRGPQGDSVVLHRLTSYNKKALWDAVQAWREEGGASASGAINPLGGSSYTSTEPSGLALSPTSRPMIRRVAGRSLDPRLTFPVPGSWPWSTGPEITCGK